MLIIKASQAEIDLTPMEQKIFSFLLEANAKLGLGSTMRVAGGWVRDKLLGKDSKDIDISLDNMKGEEFAGRLRELAPHPALGKSYVIKENPEQSKPIGTANVVIYGEPIDIVNLRQETYEPGSRIPTITMATGPDAAAKDAKRRDLTINALFYNINTSQVEDYVGGLDDLKSMNLRTPDDPVKTLLEDPLRALRWLRFFSRFENSKMDPSLIQALSDQRVHEAYKTKVSPTRAFPELRKLMEGKKPGEALRFMFDTGIHKSVFDTPQFRELADLRMDQKNKHHSYDLLEHTFRVMDNLNNVMLSEKVDPETRMLMNFASLFHDFGKAYPQIQQPHPKRPEEMTYHEHESKSADVADEILKRIGLGSKARRFVEQIIRNHMLHNWPESVPGSPSKQTTKQQRKYFEKMHALLSSLRPIETGTEGDKLPSRSYDVGEIAELALMHARSDLLGTSPGREPESEGLREHQRNVRDYYRNFWSSLRPLVRGDEIIAMFPTLKVGNIVDGKSFVAEIIEALRQKQATGQISTKEDALKLIQEMRGGIEQKYAPPRTSAVISWFNRLGAEPNARQV